MWGAKTKLVSGTVLDDIIRVKTGMFDPVLTREPDGDGPGYSSTGPAMIRLCCHDTPVVGQFNPAFFLKAKLQGQHTETDENGGVELEKDALFHLNKFVKSPRARDQYPNVEFNYAGHFQLPPLKPHVQQMQLNDAEIDESFGEPPIMRCACFHRLYLVRARRAVIGTSSLMFFCSLRTTVQWSNMVRLTDQQKFLSNRYCMTVKK